MAKRKKKRAHSSLPWNEAAHIFEEILLGSARQEIVAVAQKSKDVREGFRKMRTGIRFHRFQTGASRLDLGRLVEQLDRRTRQEGVYVLNAWHHDRHEFLSETTPVLLLDHCAGTGIAQGFETKALSILLDHYFLSLIALLSVRAWDEGDADQNLETLDHLVRLLQGASGSRFLFVDNIETLLLLTLSQYHPEEPAYERLLEKVSALNQDHRLTSAAVMATMLGGHLRWGLEDLYTKDLERLRRDNIIDYPWLLYSQLNLLQNYAESASSSSGPAKAALVRDLLNGFTADPGVFLGDPPTFLPNYRKECEQFRELYLENRQHLLDDFAACGPSEEAYSPLSFRFNFPHNALVAMVITAILQGGIWQASLNSLLQGPAQGSGRGDSPQTLARALTIFSAQPERRDTRGSVQVAYNPAAGQRSFRRTLETLERGGDSG